MGALFSSASSARRTIRCRDESVLTASARIVNVPYWLMVPLETASPAALSTGMLSPVITDWSMEVSPSRIVPSTGTVSPASTLSTSPTFTSSTGISMALPSRSTRAVCGLILMSFSMPSRAFPEV